MQASPADMSNTMAKDYQVERLSMERLRDVERLYEEVYQRKIAPNFFAIKYNSAYTGVEFLGFIAYKDDFPIAYYGVVPCFLQYQNKKILAAQSADTMSHPKFRQRGMFTELARMTFELCKISGVKLIFGFPNQNFYRAAPKLNWLTIHTMDCFIIGVDTIPIAGVSRKLQFTSHLYQWYQRLILKKYSAKEKIFSNTVTEEGFCGVLRNENYLKAKNYFERILVKSDTMQAWCRISSDLMVGDLEVAGNNIQIALNKLKRIARVLGLKQIQFHTTAGTRLHKLLSGQYPSIPSFPVIIQDFGAEVPYEQIKFTLADIDIF